MREDQSVSIELEFMTPPSHSVSGESQGVSRSRCQIRCDLWGPYWDDFRAAILNSRMEL